MRKASVSIPSNIAEGYGRRSKADYLRFLQISSGSLYELCTQIEISFLLGLISDEAYENLNIETSEVEKMLYSLIMNIKNSPKRNV